MYAKPTMEDTFMSGYESVRITTEIMLLIPRFLPMQGPPHIHREEPGIQLIVFQWDTACTASLPDPSLFCKSGSGQIGRLGQNRLST